MEHDLADAFVVVDVVCAENRVRTRATRSRENIQPIIMEHVSTMVIQDQ
jgi:hypothetical protein